MHALRLPIAVLSLALVPLLAGCPDDTDPDGAQGGGPGGGAATGTVYYSQSSDIELHELDLATGDDKKLGKGQSASVAPDGLIVYKTPTDLVESDESLVQQRIIVKATLDGDPQTGAGFAELRVSPDGTKVAYTTLQAGLYVVDRQSGALVSSFEQGGGTTKGWNHPSWTPDGRIVVSGELENPGFYLSDADLSTLDRFDPDLPKSMFADPTYLSVSHDGTKVAFVRNGQIDTMNIDGTGLAILDADETAEDTFSAWSPDDSHVAWLGKAGHMKILPAAGGGEPFDVLEAYPALADKILVFETTSQFDWK
jgi:hypothetical protein